METEQEKLRLKLNGEKVRYRRRLEQQRLSKRNREKVRYHGDGAVDAATGHQRDNRIADSNRKTVGNSAIRTVRNKNKLGIYKEDTRIGERGERGVPASKKRR